MSHKTLRWMVALLVAGLALIGTGVALCLAGQWWAILLSTIGGQFAAMGGYQTYQERKFIREMEK